MATVRYASVMVKGEELYGTAELLGGSGYLFRQDGERQATLVSTQDGNLMLYGLVDVADGQYEVDMLVGGYAAICTSRQMEVA